MKKPSLELDIESKVTKLTNQLVNDKRKFLLIYCFKKLGMHEILPEKLYMEPEDVKHFSIPVLTFRYDGKLLFREYPTGSTLQLINKRYELADIFK